MAHIKSIDTTYASYRFRSRLEARWAYWFDLVGWPWEYEPEGFDLPSGRYLPDFKIVDTFFEIKPRNMYTRDRTPEKILLEELTRDGSRNAVLVYGDPADTTEHDRHHPLGHKNTFTYQRGESEAGICCSAGACMPVYPWQEQAAVMARQARFEHGEAPARPDMSEPNFMSLPPYIPGWEEDWGKITQQIHEDFRAWGLLR